MIGRAKDWAKRHWPRMRLRTILFATLFLVAALPGFGAVFLRVYENTLVRQTEAELVAQGAALSATGAALWPAAPPGRVAHHEVSAGNHPYSVDAPSSGIDLSTTPIRVERPPVAAGAKPSPDAVTVGARLSPIMDATRSTTLASIILLDRHGTIVAGSSAVGSYAALPEVAVALAGRATTVLRRNGAYRATYRFEWLSRAAAIRVHYARPIIVGDRVVGVLLLSRSARALFRGLYEDRGKIALGIAAIFGLLVVLSGVISRGVTRPIEQLGAVTRAVSSGRGRVPEPPPTAAIEIQGLYADFAVMAAAIERRSRYLRDFAHAVSHEFKTPLAGIRGAVELLQDHPDMAEEDRRRFLANADADARRLALLVTRLLDLARADMAEPGEERTDAAQVVTRVADASRTAGLSIEIVGSDVLAFVTVPATTLEVVLGTLLENSRQAGAQSVTIQLSITDTQLQVRVNDDGPGVPFADRGRLFEPFFTTKRDTGGTGLGLAISRSLIEVQKGSLSILDGEATTFVIRLPLAH
ncbi:signal transduction histidine kinase [Sphingomonas faeni]|uniref:histidine kinase n=1 Tax=Sphingomonas faeni TaxID=185950 RepID=A0A2T5UDA1_9SPHN|nr:signal transduction histidine kinase [Sphingomonas faeni]